jgi:hypothetical protein
MVRHFSMESGRLAASLLHGIGRRVCVTHLYEVVRGIGHAAAREAHVDAAPRQQRQPPQHALHLQSVVAQIRIVTA